MYITKTASYPLNPPTSIRFATAVTLILLMLLTGIASVTFFMVTEQSSNSGNTITSQQTLQRDPFSVNQPRLSSDLVNYLSSNDAKMISVLISTTTHDYSSIIETINSIDGSVTATFQYAMGLAAEVPRSALIKISELPGVNSISLNVVRTPASTELNNLAINTPITTSSSSSGSTTSLEAIDKQLISGQAYSINMNGNFKVETLSAQQIQAITSEISPQTYANSYLMGATPVWATGDFGQNSLAVIIDTGIYSNHFMLQGSVIGGIDISTDVGTSFEGYNVSTNYFHGTHVAGILAGHGAIVVPATDLLAQAISLNSGPLPVDPNNASQVIIPLLGMAPEAQLYAIKVFPHTGAGVPESTIITGIEDAINLKVNQGLDVNIISMSLGGPTLFDGRDLEDQAVNQATTNGITVVSAAGNEGPASMTAGSPGSAFTSITVGAAVDPVHVRVFSDLSNGILGIGKYIFVSNNTQIIYFSSRGPTSDGRVHPTVSALGVYILSAFNTPGDPQGLAFASGTSMATPAVSGAVALLNTFGEPLGAAPSNYQHALQEGAKWLAGYDVYDQGAGLINASASLHALQHDLIDEQGHGHKNINTFQDTNISHGFSVIAAEPKGVELHLAGNRPSTFAINNLAPGHAVDFFFSTPMLTNRITIDVSNVNLGNNPLGFNAFRLYVQSPIRTTSGYYIYLARVVGNAEFTIEDLNTTASGATFGAELANMPLMPGYVKVVLETGWTSYSALSGTISIKVDKQQGFQPADERYFGKITTGNDTGFFSVGFGSQGVQLTLSWLHNWVFYPTSDLDLIVAWFDTNNTLNYDFSGATINSPEMVQILSPNIAAVYVLVSGFNTNGFSEPWSLSVNYIS